MSTKETKKDPMRAGVKSTQEQETTSAEHVEVLDAVPIQPGTEGSRPESAPVEASPEYALDVERAGVTAIAKMTDEEFEEQLQVARVSLDRINRLVHELLVPDVDFGKVPGVKKPLLYQEGATSLCRVFKFVPTYDHEIKYGDGETSPHVTVVSTCRLHLSTQDGPVVGEAAGACSSWEKKYRYRAASRVCPECNESKALLKSKYPPRDAPKLPPGFYCFDKKGGCGAEFHHDDKRITEQVLGEIENPNPLEQLETILQMSDKRALVMATRRTTGAGRLFTQDEELLQPARSGGSPAGETTTPRAEPSPARPTQGSRAKAPSGPLTAPPAELDFLLDLLNATDAERVRYFTDEEKQKAQKWYEGLSHTPDNLHKFRRFVIHIMKMYAERSDEAPLPGIDKEVPKPIASMAIDELNWSVGKDKSI
jgi:hypothetical protein